VLLLALSMLLDYWFNLSLTLRRPPRLNLATIVWILLYSIFGPILMGRMMTKSR